MNQAFQTVVRRKRGHGGKHLGGDSPMRIALLTTILATVCLAGSGLQAQAFRRGGTELSASRTVDLPGGRTCAVVVTDFFHHGEITPDGRNVLVSAKNRELVPMRLLQLGPGDFCRLAFQTVRGQAEYEVFYGGDPPTEALPPWTNRDGLLMETREYKDCNLHRFETVRRAFESAKPLGSDYVEQVRHGCNPFVAGQAPFMTHYSGYLNVAVPGTYGLWTASQDCSFLLIDDRVVVEAPGRHPAMHRARPGARKDVQLTSGPHKFDYYHVAAGPQAVTLAAWQMPPLESNSRPTAIGAEVFRSQQIAHLPAGRVAMRKMRLVPDFDFRIAGEVPLPDNPVPLVGVFFREASPRPPSQEKIRWDFGDGQTSDFRDADHVYLHPGVYTVKLSAKYSGRTVEMANRIAVDSPSLTPKGKLHTLDEYLRVIENYEPQTLDAIALRQLALAYEAKSISMEARAEEDLRKVEANEQRMTSAARAASRSIHYSDARSQSLKYLAKAVAAVKAALTAESPAAQGDDDLLRLAQLVGPMARDSLGDSQSALRIWQAVARRVVNPAIRAQCETEVADIGVTDLLNPAAAKSVLESAASHMGQGKTGPAAAALQRVRGDYFASVGDGKAARAAYREAERLLSRSGDYARQTARRGAHGRSTEDFLKDGQLDRAATEIRQWQQDFPAEKIDGYLTLMLARYWALRKQYPQAVAQAAQLQTVSPDSPYIDRLLYLAADCELKQGHRERAIAGLHVLQKDYPGSPLIPTVKKALAQLESEEKK